ncbi:unnamed protein product, partial [marine sediment metagenome]
AQGAALEEDDGPYSWSVMNTETLDIEDKAC